MRIGTDPMADIAVLKLKLDTRKHPDVPLAVAEWGDSDNAKVGDIVLAMGCPMAVSQSVTKGIISNTQLDDAAIHGRHRSGSTAKTSARSSAGSATTR